MSDEEITAAPRPIAGSGVLGAAACVLAAAAALMRVDSSRIADPDLFVTLYSGELISARGGPPGVDVVSFSVPGTPWLDYEWLSRLLFYRIHSALGSPGLVLMRLGLTAVVLAALFLFARRHRAGTLAFVAVVLVVLYPGLRFFLFRPALFTFALLAVWLALLDRVRDGGRWPLLVLPVLGWGWTNLHAGYGLGVVCLVLVLAESLVERFAPAMTFPLARRDAPPEALRSGASWPGVAASLGGCIAITGANPFGYRWWGGIFGTLGGEITPFISEWQPIWAFGTRHLPIVAVMVLVAIVLFAAHRRARTFDVALVAILIAAAVLRVRFVPLFALAAAFVVLRLAQWIEIPAAGRRWMAPLESGSAPRVALGLFAICVVGFWGVSGSADGQILLNEWWTPVEAVRFLESRPIEGRVDILNEYDWGGFIRWRLPNARIFLDGRSDTVYPASLTREWALFTAGSPEGNGVPEQYGARVILLRRTHPVVAQLEQDEHWVGLFVNGTSALFIRRDPTTDAWIARVRENPPTIRLSAAAYTLDGARLPLTAVELPAAAEAR